MRSRRIPAGTQLKVTGVLSGMLRENFVAVSLPLRAGPPIDSGGISVGFKRMEASDSSDPVFAARAVVQVKWDARLNAEDSQRLWRLNRMELEGREIPDDDRSWAIETARRMRDLTVVDVTVTDQDGKTVTPRAFTVHPVKIGEITLSVAASEARLINSTVVISFADVRKARIPFELDLKWEQP